jgi:hypothetical protein
MDSNTFANLFDSNSFPKLKAGVNYFKTEKNSQSLIYVGFSHRGIELSSLYSPLLLGLLDGSKSLRDIYQEIALRVADKSGKQISQISQPVVEVNEILSALHQAKFIEFRRIRSEHLVAGGFAPINLLNSRNRLQAEENLHCWRPEVAGGKSSEELIENRRNFSVIIFGRNRLAISLFSILQASGFNQIKIIDRSVSPAAAASVQIAPDEVCGLAIRGSDVGVRKSLVMADLARNSQLFPAQEISFPAIPDFIISTEAAPQETIQRWMSELIPHLAISKLIENKVEVGPIVLPGRSPCLNCLSLWRAEQFPHQKEFEFMAALDGSQVKGLELPSAQVALLSGLIAIHLIEFAAIQTSGQGDPKLVGATQSINLFDPLNSDIASNSASQYRYWQPHISCGCQQLL